MTRLMFIDIETTGLNPQIHAAIEFAGIITNEKLEELDSFTWNIKLRKGAKIEKEAMEVNQIDLKGNLFRRNAVDESQFVQYLDMNVSDHYDNKVAPFLAGWNVEFDIAFLKGIYRRNVKTSWPYPHRTLDVQSINSFMGGFKFGSLRSAHAGVKHTAYDDAKVTLLRLRELLTQRDSLKHLIVRRLV